MPVEQSQVLLGGAVVFWRLAARSDRQSLFNALASHGLSTLCPEPRTAASALKESLSDYATLRQQKVLIRGLKNSEKDGFLVLNELRGDIDNDYQKLFTCKINDLGCVEAVPINDTPDVQEIEDLFQDHRKVVTAYAVAKLLVDLVAHYRGTPLRPQGGFYWCATDVLPDLIAVASSIEQCAIGDTSAIHFIRTSIDSLSVRALRDAVIAEVSSRAKDIENASNTEGLREKTYKARQSEAQALHERVSYFENLLGEAMTELHQVADRCEVQVVQNALQTIPDFFSGFGDLSAQEVG